MVNFIIRDGDKFVLNGNELMRTENPVLEVPDIVGSEEVTEKITEDVQVGDLLYKVKRDFYPSFQTPPNNFRTYGTKFFEYDDYLHAVISDRNTTGIYKYKNDKWEVAFPKNSDDKQASPSMGGASNINPGVAAIGTTSGNAYVTYRPWAFAVDAIQPPFVGLAKFDGDILTPLDCLDASDAPNVNKLGDNSYNGVYNPTLYEASGIVHLSFPFRADYLSCGVAQYILNQDTDRLEPVTIDPSAGCGQAAYTSDITEYNNELYLVVGGGPDYNTLGVSRSNIAVWKWNLSAMNWDFYWSNATVNTNDFIRAIKFVKEGGKLYIVGAYNLNPSHDWYILNSSTSSFDSFTPTFSGNIPPQGYGQERMSAARFNGTTYITNFRGFNSDTYASGYNDQLYFGTFDHSTSTLTGSTSSIDGLQLVNSGAMRAVDLIEFNNELHLVCGGEYPNQVVFMKLNQSNNRFERNCAWDIPESADYDSMFDMEFYDFDGSTFGCVTSYGDPLKYFIYDASSTFKKFRILKDPAIAAGGNHHANKFWEYDGKLYNTIKHTNSPYRTIYEFVPSSLSFEKLATPVDSPSRSANSLDVEIFQGTPIFVTDLYTNGSLLYSEYFDGSSFVKLSDPSSIPAGRCNGMDLHQFDGKLFLSWAAYANDSNSIKVYEFDTATSSWIDIPTTLSGGFWDNDVPFNLGAGSIFYEVSGTLYLMHFSNAQPFCHTLRYDGSGFVADLDEMPLLQVRSAQGQGVVTKKIYHQGSHYFFLHGATNAPVFDRCVLKRDASGIWTYNPLANEDSNSVESPRVGVYPTSSGLNIWYSSYAYGVRFFQLDEFYNQYVWTKDFLINTVSSRIKDVGIALESGSKGDTIKIRKVKR